MKKTLLATGSIILIVAFFVYGKNLQGSIRFNSDKISPPSTAIITDELNKRLASSGNNKLSVHVVLKEQADTRGIKGNYKEIRKRKEAVVNKRESSKDEKAVRDLVTKLEQENHIAEVQKFWLVNSYSLLADNYAIRELKKKR